LFSDFVSWSHFATIRKTCQREQIR
jgi:hypothetical protein